MPAGGPVRRACLSRFGGDDDKARLTRLQRVIRTIDDAIRLYRLDFHDRLPADLSDLAGRNDKRRDHLPVEEVPKDGPDGVPGTEDDIHSRNVASKRRR